MPTIVPGKKIRPVVLVESISAIVPERRLRRRLGAPPTVAVAPSASVASISRRAVGHLVAEPVERDGGGGHRVADHHPADRDQVARLGSNTPSATTSAERRRAGHRRAPTSSGQKAFGTRLRATARGEGAEDHHHRDQREDERQAVVSKIAWIT